MAFKIQVFIGKTNKIPDSLDQNSMVYICDEDYDSGQDEDSSIELGNLVFFTTIMSRFDSLDEAIDCLSGDWTKNHNSELSLIPLTEKLSALTKTFRQSARGLKINHWSYRDTLVCAPADSKESIACAEEFVRGNSLRNKRPLWR